MLLLVLDTAGPACAVAVLRDGEMLARASEPIGKGHAERLMPMIEAALAKAGVGFEDLDRIGVATGPGSFTGVRVGVAAARGLALALGVPAVGIGSLEALFSVVAAQNDGTAVAALDAKRGEVYALAKDLSTGVTLVGATALPADALAARLGGAQDPFMLVGAGAPIVAAALSGRHVVIVATPESPDIEDVGRLAFNATEAHPPVPLYARAPDAKPQAGKAIARR